MGIDAASSTSDDMDISTQEPAPHAQPAQAGRGSDSPLFELPGEDSGPDSSATHAGIPGGAHQNGWAGGRVDVQDGLPPGLGGEALHQEWHQGSGPHSRASSPASDLPPGLDPDDMLFEDTSALRRTKQPQRMPSEVVDIPGIGVTGTGGSHQNGANGRPDLNASELRELSRSPILPGLVPSAALVNNTSAGNLMGHYEMSKSSLTSMPTLPHQHSINPVSSKPAANNGHLQNGGQAAALQGGSNSPTPIIPHGVQNGAIPIQPGAVPTQPVRSGIAQVAAAHTPSYAANGSWEERERQRADAQASWQGLGASLTEMERQAATPVRPRSALGRPQQPPQDLTLLGDPADVLLQ